VRGALKEIGYESVDWINKGQHEVQLQQRTFRFHNRRGIS